MPAPNRRLLSPGKERSMPTQLDKLVRPRDKFSDGYIDTRSSRRQKAAPVGLPASLGGDGKPWREGRQRASTTSMASGSCAAQGIASKPVSLKVSRSSPCSFCHVCLPARFRSIGGLAVDEYP